MKKITFLLCCLPLLAFANLDKDFIIGDPGIKSINAITFGPDGILFVGDSQNASIYAIETADKTFKKVPEKFEMDHVDDKIADLLGTTKDAIKIQDLAINPISKRVYIALHLQDGSPAIVITTGGDFKLFETNAVGYQKLKLTGAVDAETKGSTWSLST